MKHYIEIQKVRDEDIIIDNTLILPMIVTEARVMKMFHKLVDDGIIPEQFELKDMKIVAQNLPKCVYEELFAR